MYYCYEAKVFGDNSKVFLFVHGYVCLCSLK